MQDAVGSRYDRAFETVNKQIAEHKKDVQDRLVSQDVRMESLENSARVQTRATAKMQEQLKAALNEIGVLQNTELERAAVDDSADRQLDHTILRARTAARIESVQEIP